METRYKRLLRLEEEKNGQDMDLSEEQIKLLEKANPCFRERNILDTCCVRIPSWLPIMILMPLGNSISLKEGKVIKKQITKQAA